MLRRWIKINLLNFFSNIEYSERKTPGNKMSTVGGKYFKMDKGGESTLIIRYILSKYQPSMTRFHELTP